MQPDINLKSFYLQFISNAKIDITKYKESLATTKQIKEELYNYINNNKDNIEKYYNININEFNTEWTNKRYNTSKSLYNKVIKLININDIENPNRIILLQLAKYCTILSAEYKYETLIEQANKRKSIKYNKYREYVMSYYNKVHKCVLEGMGYKFSYGIGTFCCNYWRFDNDKIPTKPRLDYAATNAKKKELIKQGVKLYNDNEAAWFAARKIPYNGVDYRVWSKANFFYDFTFIKSNLFTSTSLDFDRTEYVSSKYRGLSYTDIADKYCKTIEDVYNIQLDIKYKLNIILYKDPTKYLNFIRNAEQCKYKPGAHTW